MKECEERLATGERCQLPEGHGGGHRGPGSEVSKLARENIHLRAELVAIRTDRDETARIRDEAVQVCIAQRRQIRDLEDGRGHYRAALEEIIDAGSGTESHLLIGIAEKALAGGEP